MNQCRKLLCGLIVTGVLICHTADARVLEWSRLSTLAERSPLIHIQSQTDPDRIYIGSENKVYGYDIADKELTLIFDNIGSDERITSIYISGLDAQLNLIGTNKALYRLSAEGHLWKRIYDLPNDQPDGITAVTGNDLFWVVGFKGGVFIQNGAGKNWMEIGALHDDESVLEVRAYRNHIVIVTNRRVMLYGARTGKISELYRSMAVIKTDDQGLYGGISAADIISAAEPWVIFIDGGAIKALNLDDSDWIAVPGFVQQTNVSELSSGYDRNCTDTFVRCIRVIVATDTDIQVYDRGRWVTTYAGLPDRSGLAVEINSKGEVFGVQGPALYQMDFDEDTRVEDEADGQASDLDYDVLKGLFAHEPGIRQVHRWAIDYADVGKEKIDRWKRDSRRKALLPSLDLGVDGDQDVSISDTIYGSSSGNIVIGPDDKSNGRGYGWDVSLSWDLGDVIWSTDQTTIDSRAKLNVELREDILDQVTRLYFERRRLQFEVYRSMPEDSDDRLQSLLRIDELSALLDSLTGGKFLDFY